MHCIGVLPYPHSFPTRRSSDRAWSRQGVMLLNRVLTVAPGQPASHRGKGWEEITERAITALIERDQPLVAILWGRDARSLAPRSEEHTSELQSRGHIVCRFLLE